MEIAWRLMNIKLNTNLHTELKWGSNFEEESPVHTSLGDHDLKKLMNAKLKNNKIKFRDNTENEIILLKIYMH